MKIEWVPIYPPSGNLKTVAEWVYQQLVSLRRYLIVRNAPLQEYADDVEAAAAGLEIGDMYHTAGQVRIRTT